MAARFVEPFRALELALRHRGSFGAILGTHQPGATLEIAGDRLSLRGFVVPPRLAGASDGRLTLGAALALFDEVSTLNLCAVDRGRRPGVSVSLSAWRTARLPPAGATTEAQAAQCKAMSLK